MGEQSPHEAGPGARNRSRQILHNTLSSYGRDILDTVTFLILIPFLIRALGMESFGLWSLVWSFLALFELADLGFGASVVKYVAEARGKGDPERLTRIVCTLFWIYIALGALVALGILASLLFFNRIFDIPPDQADMARTVLLILGLRSALYLPLGMFRGVLVGHQKMQITNIYKILGNLLYFGSVLAGLTLIPDIRLLALLNMVTGLLPMLAMMLHVWRVAPDVRLHPRFFDRRLVREVTSFSMYFSFIQIAGMIATRADAMIIKLFLPLEMVAVYAIGMRLSEKAGLFCSQLTRVLSPVVAELHGASDAGAIRAVWYRGTKLTAAFATPLLLGLGLLADPLVRAWTGPEFETAATVCQWLSAAVMVSVFHGTTMAVLSMGGHQKVTAFALVGGQVLNVVLSLVLIRTKGITGVAMATFLAYVPLYIGVMQTYAGKVYQRSLWDFYRRTLLPVLPPALLMTGLFLGVGRLWHLTHLLEVALLEVVGTGVFFLAFWGVGLDRDERTYFKEKVFRALARKGRPSTLPKESS